MICSIFFRYLKLIFHRDRGPVRLQDFKEICDAMSLTPEGIEAMTNFLLYNIRRICWTVPNGENIVRYMYNQLASKVSLDREIIKVRSNRSLYINK